MTFEEYAEQRLDEAVVNVSKTFDLSAKLKQNNINLDNIFEDGAKIIGYITHINAADGNAAQAARTLNVSKWTFHSKDKQNALNDYNIPEKFWTYK
jgi:hypothetical protein